VAVVATLFDRRGARLAEIEPAWDLVSWRLNGVGMARFSLPYSDPKCTPDNLQFGNRLLVEFSNGLPDWGGVIDVPRRRDAYGVTITAYTGEQLLNWRVTAKGRYFAAQMPGAIFESLITEENATWPTGVTVGSVYSGGTARTIEYHRHDLLARIQDLARLTGHDFAVLPVITGGELTFQANWYERRGSDKSDQVELIEGLNLGLGAQMDAQGPLANRVILVGEGTGWGDDRLEGIAEDATSRDLYGYREYAEVQSGVTEQTTLDANATALASTYAYPRARLDLPEVLNLPPARYADYDVGDDVATSVLLAGATQGWESRWSVRVLAREWTKASEACRLVVDEYG
jgi:hypothetical protein